MTRRVRVIADSLCNVEFPRAVVMVEREVDIQEPGIYGGSVIRGRKRELWYFTGRTRGAELVDDPWRMADGPPRSDVTATGPQRFAIAEYSHDGDPTSDTRWFTFDGREVEIR